MTSQVQIISSSLRPFQDSSNRLNSITHGSKTNVRSINLSLPKKVNPHQRESVIGGENDNAEYHKRSLNQQQMNNISKSSKSCSQEKVKIENNIIEEIRTAPDGSKSVHKYIRGKMLGKGGFAKVYLCTSLDAQKSYAVKIVPKANLVKSRARQKLQAEIKIHRVLRQERICEFKHFFEDRTNCYILLELCHNQTLNEVLKRRKRLTEWEVMYYMVQMIEGVQYLHKCNIIHRDLKLGNVFLDKNMNVKIGDFGLAVKLAKSTDKRTTICGTPNYIAPEVIDCLNGGERGHSFEVDVWAMGVIMYATLFGKPPYEAKDVKSTYQRILNNEYYFPEKYPVSGIAKDLINGMLQSNPGSRPNIAQVATHPFFAHARGKIPLSLPIRCARMAPTWVDDGKGSLIAEFPEGDAENLSSQVTMEDVGKEKKSELRRPLSLLNSDNKDQREFQASIKKAQGCYSSVCKEKVDERTQHKGDFGTLKLKLGNGVKDTEKLFPGMGLSTKEANCIANTRNPNQFAIYNEAGELESHRAHGQQSCPVDNVQEPIKNLAKDVENCHLGASNQIQNVRKGLTTRERSDIKFHDTNKKAVSSAAYSKIENVVNGACAKRTDIVGMMHHRLQESFTASGQLIEHTAEPVQKKSESSQIWVTSYVDYTSKYGLGFLLNDGSAGVYYNDSTKAVLSPEGDVFQYIERRKAPAEVMNEEEIDPTIHIYSLSSFPDTLQKKVTLLKHFRNYLVQQDKKTSDKDSIDQEKLLHKNKIPETESSTNSVCPYVYLKKWVRTRHAILFRLSNCTVQVVFYDQTEVLLSSEARLVTYVDKTGARITYPIHEVTKNPNGEVGKRLKYAKDILQQLISGVKR